MLPSYTVSYPAKYRPYVIAKGISAAIKRNGVKTAISSPKINPGSIRKITNLIGPSRYWVKNQYEERFKAGESQLMLDKENIRQWLIQKGL